MTVRELIEQLQECHPDDQVAHHTTEPSPIETADGERLEDVAVRSDPLVAVGQLPGGRPVVLIKPGERW